jgi:hypothetical protein
MRKNGRGKKKKQNTTDKWKQNKNQGERSKVKEIIGLICVHTFF